MKKLATHLLYASLMFVSGPAFANEPIDKSADGHQATVRQARASYAYAPRHRHHRHFGGMAINPRDPVKRALDDPYMYGRPDRH